MPEPSVPRPGEFFIGVIDFFAILVPGVAGAAFGAWATGHLPEKPESLFFLTILLLGFIVGHVLHGLGSFLDDYFYDWLYKPLDTTKRTGIRAWKPFRANDALYLEARRLADPGHTPPGIPLGGMYQWARAWLRVHSPEATSEVDRLEADSKFFRSLAVLMIGLALSWSAYADKLSVPYPAALALLVFSLWRYCNLRQKTIRTCYLHYVQLRSEDGTLLFKHATM